MKNIWETPKLIAIIRKTEETVILGCKTYFIGTRASDNDHSGCTGTWRDQTCQRCSSLGSS
jgi:hypothetical protein